MILMIILLGMTLALVIAGVDLVLMARAYILLGMVVVVIFGHSALLKRHKNGIFAQWTEPGKFHRLDINLARSFWVGIFLVVMGLILALCHKFRLFYLA